MLFTPKRLRAFTLVELLVCIAIIAILGAILVPAISGIRERAAGSKSLSNLRQIGTAMQMYINDNDGYLPGWASTGQAWYHVLMEDGKYGLPEASSDAFSPVLYSPLSGKDGTGGWPAHNPDYGINLSVVDERTGQGEFDRRKLINPKDPAKLLLMVSTGTNGDATTGDFRFSPEWEDQLTSGPKPNASDYSGHGWMAFRYPSPHGENGDMTGSSAVGLFVDFHVEMIPFDDPRLQTIEGREEMFLP